MAISRRALLRSAAMGLGTAALAACGDKDAKTLNYQTWMMSEAGVNDYWNASIDAFKKANAGVQVNLTNTPPNAYNDKITTEIGAGEIPDLLPVFTNQIYRLLAADMLEPLDDRLAKTSWAGRELPVAKAAKKDGKTYGVVLTASPQGLIYNKKLLDQAGVDVPATPDAFMAACQAVKQKTGAWGYALPMASADVQNVYIATMQWVLGCGSDWTKPDGTPTADAAGTIEGITWMRRLIQSGAVPTGMTVVNTRNLFSDGKVAFMIDGPWLMTQVRTHNADLYPSIGFAEPPTPTHAAVTGGAFWVLMRKSKKQDLAWKYIDMVNQEDWQRRWMEATEQLPGQSLAPSEGQLKRSPWMPDMIRIGARYLTGFGYAPPSPAVAQHAGAFQKLIVDNVLPLLSSSDPIEAGLKKTQAAVLRWEQDNHIVAG